MVSRYMSVKVQRSKDAFSSEKLVYSFSRYMSVKVFQFQMLSRVKKKSLKFLGDDS